MPALLTATVLRWRVEVIGEEPFVSLANHRRVELFVEDESADADFSPIIAEFIRTTKDADPNTLLEEARDGLLQVVRHESTAVTRPAVPSTRRAQLLRAAEAQRQDALRDLLGPRPPADPNDPAAPGKRRRGS